MNDQLAEVAGYADKRAAQNSAEQRSAAWLYERVGHCTASKFADVMAVVKSGKESAPRRNYRVKLAVERLMNAPTSSYVNAAMEWGTEQEANAKMAYEAQTGAIIEDAGFIHHPKIEWCGGSPDGLIGSDGLIECKCPFEPAVHVMTMLDKTCEHIPQIQGLLWITNRKWCDFVSYDPRMPDGLQLYVQRIERDDTYIAELAGNVLTFLAEVDAMHKSLMAMATSKTAPPQASPASPSTGGPAAAAAYITADEALILEARCTDNSISPLALKKAAKVERLSQILAADLARAHAWVDSAIQKRKQTA